MSTGSEPARPGDHAGRRGWPHGTTAFTLLVGAWVAGTGRALFHYDASPILSLGFQLVIGTFLFGFVIRSAVELEGRFARGDRWVRLLMDPAIATLAALLLILTRFDHVALALSQWVVSLRVVFSWPDVRSRFPALESRPARLIATSFIAVISLGTALLASPRAAAGDVPASLVDALFTATSASCVTGLVVVDTGTFWSPFGRNVILLLIEAGALGIMTLWASVLILTGRRLGYIEEATLSGLFEQDAPKLLRQTTRRIVIWALATQAVGAIVLWPALVGQVDGGGAALGHAVFHAVSAFCNAGFTLYPDNLSRFVGDPAVSGVVMALIVLGGLGFPVLDEIQRRLTARFRGVRPRPFSLHARMVLWISAGLTAVGAISIFHFEYDASLAGLGVPAKLLAALFQSVTLRTAGFNTVPTEAFTSPILLMMMAFMFIGAAPASTGGGVKVTSIGILALTIKSSLHERPLVEAFGRHVPPGVVQKATAIVLIGAMLLLTFLAVLLIVEDQPFLPLAFETTSAFGTVGLSIGATDRLTVPGRLAIIALMFLGRIGPLTLALAVGHRALPVRYRYPEGRLLVG